MPDTSFVPVFIDSAFCFSASYDLSMQFRIKITKRKKKTLTSSPTMPDMLFVPVFVDTDYHLSSSCIFCRLQAVHVKKSIVSIKKMQRRKDNTHFGSKRHQTHRLCPFSDLVVTRRNDARITCHHHGRVCVCSCYWT